MSRPGYMAIDERSGETLHLGAGPPRKVLLDRLGRRSARKMYVDKKDGTAKHIGYVVGGGWYRIYEVHDWNVAA